jgi:hypothetical protein
MSPSSASNNHRRGGRTKAVLPVRLKGKDSSGKMFDELVHTLDVNPSGVRLGSVRRDLSVQEEVAIFYRGRKMLFRVIWTRQMKGSSEFQVGLQAVTQEREAWGISLSQLSQPVMQATA